MCSAGAVAGSGCRFRRPRPELIRFFGGEENLDDVRNNSPSTFLDVLLKGSKPPPPPRAIYTTDIWFRLSELLATSDSYDWTKPTDGEFDPDIRVEFTGPRYWQAEREQREGVSIVVRLDLHSEILEVKGTGVHGRASFAPAAERLDDLLARAGIQPPPPK